MEKLLKLITDGEALSTEQMGKILGLTRDELDAEFQKLVDANILLGWRAVLNPERDGGFDKLAQRISKFDQVDSCFLMSGAYDLLLFVKAKSLRGVASFVYEKLATIGGVTSTATHFFLKTYKQQGFIIQKDSDNGDRLIYSP